MGGPKSQETLRTALAKGADKAIHVEVCSFQGTACAFPLTVLVAFNVQVPDADIAKVEPLHVARVLQKIVDREKFDVVFLGKQVRRSFCLIRASTLKGVFRQSTMMPPKLHHSWLVYWIGRRHSMPARCNYLCFLSFTLYIPPSIFLSSRQYRVWVGDTLLCDFLS